MGKYLEIAGRLLARSASDARSQRVSSKMDLPVADVYAERVRIALSEINDPNYRMGMVPWLLNAHPDLYERLTSILPDKLHELWSQRVPLAEFEELLGELVSLHRHCRALHRWENRHY